MSSECPSVEGPPDSVGLRAGAITAAAPEYTWRIWDADVAADHALWQDLWEHSPSQNPFAHPRLCRLLAPADSRLLAATMSDGRGHVLYPFCLREIEAPARTRSGEDSGFAVLHDIVSPYGYGGPSHWGLIDVDEAAARFWPPFDAWAREHSVVSEFIRFSLFEAEVLPYPGGIRTRQTNFVRALDRAPEEMWAGHEFKKVRKNAKRAVRQGTSIVFDDQGEFIDEFLKLYIGTMERRSSSAWYRFDRSFFEGIQQWLAGRFVYVFARLDGQMVSADLLLLGSDTGYDFLGGTNEDSFSVRPNDLVKVETMRWLHERGFSRFVIGGGLTSGDTLERYKRGFAPHGEVPFRTGERVIAQTHYDTLTADIRRQFSAAGAVWSAPEDFFPAYRRTFVPVDAITTPSFVEEV